MRLLFIVLAVLLIVPGWTGDERLSLPLDSYLRAERVALHPDDPAVRRTGRLRFLGGVALSSGDPAFGGYSALHVAGERFVLLGDGGNVLSFRMSDDWRPREATAFPLPAGPGTGWRKRDRDTESLARDPRSGRWWIGFERDNSIWRFTPDFARIERARRPPAMRRWSDNGGAEAMVRLRDGRFVVLAEKTPPRRAGAERPRGRQGVVFAGDPTDPAVRAAPFTYRPTRRLNPVDMAELPDGRLLVLERNFEFPFDWVARLMVVEADAIRPGATVAGREVARFEAPLLADNFEGIAVAREGGATVVWLVSDNNQSILQQTLLLKFRLDDRTTKSPPSRDGGPL